MSGKLVDKQNLEEIFNIIESEPTKPSDEELNPNDMGSINRELARLLTTGNFILESTRQQIDCNLDNPDIINASAKLIDSLRDTLKEFSRIHYQNAKHNQSKELELIKLAGKKQLLDQKIKAMKELNPGNTGSSNTVDTIPLHSFSQEDMVRNILLEKNKQEEQKKLV